MDYLEDDNLDQMTASLGVMKRWMDLEPFNSGNFKFSDNYSDSYKMQSSASYNMDKQEDASKAKTSQS